MTKKSIVILDANNTISSGGYDVLRRHDNYAAALDGNSRGEFELVLITTKSNSSQPHDFQFSTLRILTLSETKLNKLIFWYRAFSKVKNEKLIIHKIVVGDPWWAGVNGILFRKLVGGNCPIQIQIHADIGAKKWGWQNLQSIIKYYLAKSTLIRASTIRAVSERQADNLRLILKKNVPIIVIPVPLNLGRILMNSPDSVAGSLRFGFLGRLAKDRGTDQIGTLLSKIRSLDSLVTLVIAGYGPELRNVLNELSDKFPQVHVKNLGYLPIEKLDTFWCEIDILLSLAPFESYGRVAREAIANSRPVLAIPSSGILDLQDQVSAGWLQIIDSGFTSEELLQRVEILRSRSSAENTPLLGNEYDQRNIQLLINSWMQEN
jgi:glycosyltransferase involved in cell wall biosynthesis